MKKQIYVTPEVTVVHMTSCEHLLAGSANTTYGATMTMA